MTPGSLTDGPARNRVTPLGEIVAAPGRGAWTGNRGILHEGRGSRDVVRTSRNRAWITCVLDFRGRRVPQWEPGHWTALFFLDEAVALAAGHRPCAYCRRAGYNAFRAAWSESRHEPLPSAKELDAQLHSERGQPWRAPWPELPDGAFVQLPDGPAVIRGDRLTVWRADNTYGAHQARPRHGRADVVTPPSTVATLRAGYPVQLSDEAGPTASG